MAIAAELRLSHTTVSRNRTRVLEKLDLTTNQQLIQYARDQGFIQSEVWRHGYSEAAASRAH